MTSINKKPPRHTEKVERPLSCPCCGNKKLYIGHLAALVLGVKCEPYDGGCGLRMQKTIPDRMPASVQAAKPKDAMRALDIYTLKLAIKAWNKRKTV